MVVGQVTISGATTVCQNGTQPVITFSNPNPQEVIVTYDINGGPDLTINVNAKVGTTDGTATVNVPTGTSGTFEYKIISAITSPSPGTTVPFSSATSIITVVRTPNVTISGTATVCEDAAQPEITFTNPTNAIVKVTYKINAGFDRTITVNANTTNTVSQSTGTPGTFEYTLVSAEYNSFTPSCPLSLTGTATITVRSTPKASISGTTTVCQNGTQPQMTFTNPMNLPVKATFDVNNGLDQTVDIPAKSGTIDGTATRNAPTAAASTFAYKLLSVAYQTAPGCSNSVTGTATATVTVRPTPTASISGTVAVAQGKSPLPKITFTNKKESNVAAAALVFELLSDVTGRISVK